ncbi:hypothetical protein AVEN_51045-1 [Araneus ventricosus]|uniref:Uncharacterized protein n=1 Tax=Araneus ventricosus TaxID=182803 RepID=A0A4Y2CGM1_ARAVE|nr:hypothetical protein AVEN_51045-1 [Araneus ventricosus]
MGNVDEFGPPEYFLTYVIEKPNTRRIFSGINLEPSGTRAKTLPLGHRGPEDHPSSTVGVSCCRVCSAGLALVLDVFGRYCFIQGLHDQRFLPIKFVLKCCIRTPHVTGLLWMKMPPSTLQELFNPLNPARKFQKDDTQVWAINCQQRKEPLFSRKIHSGARNRLSPASVEWGGLRRDRVHRVNSGSVSLNRNSNIYLASKVQI